MIIELYSKRLKKKFTDEVYMYDQIPKKLRIQIMHLWEEIIEDNDDAWDFIRKILRKELGIIDITEDRTLLSKYACKDFLLNHKNINEVLDIIELSFVIIEIMKLKCDEAIEELNYRFKENSVGYEYINGKIIRKDREFTHNEIIKPSIKLLYEEEFEGACNEFLKAHKNYREKNYKEAILNAQKAFESTMKTICEKKEYTYDKNKDTASKLIKILCEYDLIPVSLKSHFEGLKALLSGVQTSLEAGLPVLRNKSAGHGQGATVVYIPEHLATYALNLSATNIVLLVNLYKDKK